MLVERTPHPGPLPIGSADSADAEREKRSQRLGDVLSRVVHGFNARIFRGILTEILSPPGVDFHRARAVTRECLSPNPAAQLANDAATLSPSPRRRAGVRMGFFPLHHLPGVHGKWSGGCDSRSNVEC